MQEVAILIPCYNESATIEKVIRDCRRVMPEATVYVYDNNSTDGSAALAEKAGAVVRHEYKQGKGNVIRRMFREIDAMCYIMIDADDTYPVEQMPDMVRLIQERGAQMVVGDRLSSTYFQENKRPFHNFGNMLVRKSINLLFHTDLKDMMTGYRAFSYEFVKTFPVLSRGFEIETEMSIHAADKNLQVENIVVQYRDRPQGSESKLNTYSDGMRVLGTILRLFRNYRPLHFFSWVAAILLLAAAALFAPVLVTYLQTGLVPRFPTLIVSGFAVIAAIQAFVGGLILDTIAQQERQNFEIQFHQAADRKKRIFPAADEVTAGAQRGMSDV